MEEGGEKANRVLQRTGNDLIRRYLGKRYSTVMCRMEWRRKDRLKILWKISREKRNGKKLENEWRGVGKAVSSCEASWGEGRREKKKACIEED